jgi:hypothetical protein
VQIGCNRGCKTRRNAGCRAKGRGVRISRHIITSLRRSPVTTYRLRDFHNGNSPAARATRERGSQGRIVAPFRRDRVQPDSGTPCTTRSGADGSGCESVATSEPISAIRLGTKRTSDSRLILPLYVVREAGMRWFIVGAVVNKRASKALFRFGWHGAALSLALASAAHPVSIYPPGVLHCTLYVSVLGGS